MTIKAFLGRFDAVSLPEGSQNEFFPDQHQLPSQLSGRPVTVEFGMDFRDLMRDYAISRQFGSNRLLNHRCLVVGRLVVPANTSKPLVITEVHSFQLYHDDDPVDADGQIQRADVVWLKGGPVRLKNLVSLDDITRSSMLDSRSVRTRGYLVDNTSAEIAWLVRKENLSITTPPTGAVVLAGRIPGDLPICSAFDSELPDLEYDVNRLDLPFMRGGWATVDGVFHHRKGDSDTHLLDTISCISIETHGRYHRVWFDPSAYRWHTDDFEQES